MTLHRNRRMIAAIVALLFPALACRAATRLIIPDTPTPIPSPTATFTPTLTPFPPATFTPTSLPEASCPVLTTNILTTALEFEFESNEDVDDEEYLVTYIVNGDAISSPFYEPVPEDLRDEQDDRARHDEIWNYFARLIPLEERDFLTAFAIITDGSGSILGAVGQSSDEPGEWILEVDIVDSADHFVLTFTLLHEFAHLLTLNSSQVPPSTLIFDNPNSESVYQSELAACPYYFPGEGCSNPDSYVNRFFDRFWPHLFAEWQEIDSETDEDIYYDLLDDFYDTYQDQFLTDYAATSPAEDIAESFAFFILSPKPELTSIANEKILFFYEHPELVELRRRILNQLCVEFPQ